jgi:hypothetical protein
MPGERRTYNDSRPPRGEDGSTPPPCDTPSLRSAVRREFAEITERFEKAHNRALRAQTIEDWEAAEAERRDIAGEFWAAGEDLADLLLMLLRYGMQHRPEALEMYLAEILRPQFRSLAQSIARLERGR